MDANPPEKLPASVANDQQELELEDQIRVRAYELYEARGSKDGHEMEDWLRAEEEITGKQARPIAAFSTSFGIA